MKKIIFIILSVILLSSCKLFNTTENRYVGLQRPEVPKEFAPPPEDANPNGVILVYEDGSLMLPPKEERPQGKSLYSVHVYVAPNDTYTPNLTSAYSNFGMQLKTTGTPPTNAQSLSSHNSELESSLQTIAFDNDLYTHPYTHPESTGENIYFQSEQSSSNYNLVNSRAFIGEQQSITTGGQGGSDIRNITIECVASTAHADFFIETAYKSSFEKYKTEYANRFESHYNKMITDFRSPTSRVKVMIVLYPSGISGTIENGGVSVNINELLYGNGVVGSDYDDLVGLSVATVFHEMQHMIFRQARGAMELSSGAIWLEEGLSEYARDITSFDKENDVRLLFGSLGTKGLLSFGGSVPSDVRNSYSLSYLFVQYLIDRFGIGIIDELYEPGPPLGSEADTKPRSDGVHPLSAATGIYFDELYFDFAIAVAIHGLKAYDANIPAKYRFTTPFRKTDRDGNFVDDELVTVVAIPADAGGTGEIEGGIRQVKNHLNPFAVKVYKWEGDVDTIEVPVPLNKNYAIIKSAVFYAD